MGRELSHADAAELLGVYALDALDPDEREAVEAHAAECGACQAEITQHREVAAFLAPGWTPAPEGLWNRIVADLEETPPPLAMPAAPVTSAAPVAPGAPVAPVIPIDRPSRRSRPMAAVAAMVAVAAVALIAVLGYKVVDDSRRIDSMKQQALGTEFDQAVNAARADPAARRVKLQDTNGTVGAEAVVLPDGSGFLTNKALSALPADRTYQLWAVVGTNKISVGVLGSKVDAAGFKAPTNASAFALTNEKAGGVVTSINSPVVVGTV